MEAGSTTETFVKDGRTYHRSKCRHCPWTSKDLPFPDPAAALHALKLHGVLCQGRTNAT
jgi:hypothetical protein